MNILITGGASGLGRAITLATVRAFPDANVYFTFHASGQAAAALEKENKNSKGIKCDFRKDNEVHALCQFIDQQEIDVLVNNAFTGLQTVHFHKTNNVMISESFGADILPTLDITRAFIHKARERKSGKIITILTSALSSQPPTGWSIYLANKAYLMAMHRSWATENRMFNITSNCISPDFMATPLHKDMDERVLENMIKSHPLKKLLTPGEVADLVVYLCKASSHLNGQNIVMNAGIL
jgi:3-oxoacyl-[acyl-carrier protein] reductase